MITIRDALISRWRRLAELRLKAEAIIRDLGLTIDHSQLAELNENFENAQRLLDMCLLEDQALPADWEADVDRLIEGAADGVSVMASYLGGG